MNKLKLNTLLIAILGSLFSLAVQAQDDDTITVLEEGETPEDVFVEISLPEAASDEARENAAQGLDTANSARELGREFGEQMADEARSGNLRDEMGGRPDLDNLPGGAPGLDELPGGAPDLDELPDSAQDLDDLPGGPQDLDDLPGGQPDDLPVQ